eukprot:TRINITY_DN74638_c0_g1_i1.p1 TRINITY_DN74638_c0_g1~~TRINITY_DN74638_c0_g1_i1.p1  ORF type:complete len:291 (+),score=39.08 TRINITY_DN74638_c0_g1_i1:93-965(+)
MCQPSSCVDRPSVDEPPAAPCLRPSAAPCELDDLMSFELPAAFSVEVCSVSSSMSTCILAEEAVTATTMVPPSAPRFCPSVPPFDLALLPPFELPASCELPQTSEISTEKPTSTSSRSANAVPTGCSARWLSVGEVHRVLPLAPLSKPLSFVSETNLEEMPPLELPPSALTLSGGPRLRPSADPFDLEDFVPLELPPAMLEMPSHAATSPFDNLPNLHSTLLVERLGKFTMCDTGLRKQALQQTADSQRDCSLSWSTSTSSLKYEPEWSPSMVSTSASEFASRQVTSDSH